jgi:hypothetical protein
MSASGSSSFSDAEIARVAGRPDESLAILLALLRSDGGPRQEVVSAAIEVASAVARDVAAVDALHRELGWQPFPRSPGAPRLDSGLLQQLRDHGPIGLLRMQTGEDACRYQIDLHAADAALATGATARAIELLAAVPRELCPVPWHLLSGRIALLRGDATAALDALTIPLALRPHIPDIYAAIGEVMKLGSESKAADVEAMTAEADARSGANWLGDFTLSPVPLRHVERYARWVVIPALRQSVALFLQRAAELHGYLLLARKCRDLLSALRRRQWRLAYHAIKSGG